MPLMSLRRFLARFGQDRSGLSAIEFALIVPVMLISLIGAIEVSNGMLADRKVTQTVSTVADLVAQHRRISNSQMSGVFDAAGAIMAPLSVANMGLRVSSVTAQPNGTGRVDWSEARNMLTRTTGSTVALPAGVLANGETMIFAEVTYSYSTSLSHYMLGGFTMADRFYLRPRRSAQVVRVP